MEEPDFIFTVYEPKQNINFGKIATDPKEVEEVDGITTYTF